MSKYKNSDMRDCETQRVLNKYRYLAFYEIFTYHLLRNGGRNILTFIR